MTVRRTKREVNKVNEMKNWAALVEKESKAQKKWYANWGEVCIE